MAKAYAFALVALVALAGCSDKDSDGLETPDIKAGDLGGDGTGGGGQSVDGDNTAPFATLTSDVDFGVVGTKVTFTLAAIDDDGDLLAWSFDANNDGAEELTDADGTVELPQVVNYTYATAGNYSARLVVTDGKLNVNATLSVTIVGGGGAETWYILRGPADCTVQYLSKVANESIACGPLGAPTSFITPSSYEFVADGPSYGHGSGTAFTGQLMIDYTGVLVGDVSWTLATEDGDVAMGSQAFATAGVGSETVPIAGTTTADIAPGATLVLRVQQASSSAEWYLPGAGSGFTLGGEYAPPA